MNLRILILSFVFALSACNNAADNTGNANSDTLANMKLATDSNVIAAAIDSSHTAKNSLDWKGNYKGVLPCPDCAGIVTEIMLHEDGTYMMSTQYLGKKDSKVNKVQGKFIWIDGSNIQLNGIKYAIPPKYFVAEGKIVKLDVDGKMIDGEFADKYILKKD